MRRALPFRCLTADFGYPTSIDHLLVQAAAAVKVHRKWVATGGHFTLGQRNNYACLLVTLILGQAILSKRKCAVFEKGRNAYLKLRKINSSENLTKPLVIAVVGINSQAIDRYRVFAPHALA